MQSRNLLGVGFVRDIEKYKSVIIHQCTRTSTIREAILTPLFEEKSTIHYYVTPKAVDECSKVKLGNTFRYDWVRAKVENGLKQWSFGKKMMRFYRYGNTLLIIYAKIISAASQLAGIQQIIKDSGLAPHINPAASDVEALKAMGLPRGLLPDPSHKEVNYVLLKMNMDMETCDIVEGMPKTMPLAQEAFLHFRQMLYFILLAPTELVVVPPGAKHGKRGSNDRLLNEEKFPMIVIDANWNKIAVREEQFWVLGDEGIGFPRQQRYGVGNSLSKDIWIDPFIKKGYRRGATKEKGQNNLSS